MKYGLLADAIDLGAYIFGKTKVPTVPYNPSGDWSKALPEYENQTTKFGDETSGCTVWGSQNLIEIFYKHVYGEEPNYSERFTYLLAGIDPKRGGNPHKTLETIREYGLIPNSYMPMTDSINDFVKNDITDVQLLKGKAWLDIHDFNHEWVWNTTFPRPKNWKDLLREALTTSPIGVSVTAWREQDGLYVSDNGGNNHWCVLYKIDKEGKMYVFDSYDHSKKVLHPEHNIRRAKRIHVSRKDKSKEISFIRNLLKLLMPKTLVELCESCIGKDVTPMDNVPDEVACAETVSTLVRKVYPDFPFHVSTANMDKALQSPTSNWMLVDVPEAGDIVISPTVGKKIGHVGICMGNNFIASNNSFGVNRGLFTKNYSVLSWNNVYKKKGLEVKYYRRIT